MTKYILTLFVIIAFLDVAAQITWEKKDGPYGGNITTTEIAPNGNIFTLTDNTRQIYKSTNNGINWSLIDITGLDENEDIVEIKIGLDGTVYAVTGFANFYSSADDGASWNKVNTGTDFSDGGFDSGNQLAINPTTGELLLMGYASGDPVVYISNDGGANWIVGATLDQQYDDILVASYGSSGMIFVYSCCGSARVFASSDGGFSFTEQTAGLGDISINDMAVGSNGTDVFLLNRFGVFKWDGFDIPSLGWIDITENLPAGFVQSGVLCTVNSAGVDYLFYGDNDNNVLYRKDLSGTSNWTTLTTTFAVDGSEAKDIDAKSNNLIFASSQSKGMFRTTNGALSWIDSNDGIENQRFSDIIISDNFGNLIVAGEQHVYFSDDEGESWDLLDLAGGGNYTNINSFLKLDNGNIYGYGSVSRMSSDEGQSWDPIADPFVAPAVVRKVVNSDQTRFFALNFNDNEITFSDDAGTTWSPPISISFPLTNYYIDDIFVSANNEILAVVRNFDIGGWEELYKITFTPDPGVGTPTTGTVTLINTSTPGYTITATNLETVKYRNGKLYALGRDSNFDWKLCISSDGGNSFSSKTLNDGGYGLFITANGYILIPRNDNNNDHSFYVSRDEGDTFVSTTVGSAFKGSIRGIELDDNGFAFALLEFKGVYKSNSTIILPEPPINLTQVGRGASGLTLRFEDASLSEEGFVIQREINGTFQSIDTTGNNFLTGEKRYFQDRGLQPSTTYNYRVAAYNDAGASIWVLFSVATLPQTTPEIPDNRSWTGQTVNIDGLAPIGTNTTIAIKHLGNGRYSISDVTAGILAIAPFTEDAEIPAFFYETSNETYLEPLDGPIHEEQNGSWDGTDQITLFWRLDNTNEPTYPDKYEQITLTLNTTDPSPDAPTNVRAFVYSNTSIEVTWKGTFFEEEFIIERGNTSTGPFTEVGRVNYPATTFVDDGTAVPLTPGNTYFYQVMGSNSTGPSPASAVSPGVTLTSPKFVLSNSAVSTESQGTGIGFIWGDYDNDGDEDAVLMQLTFVIGAPTTPIAFRNDGDGSFTSVDAGFEPSRYLIGAAADYDNDGNLDIFMTTTATENILYKGNGNFTFTKVDPNPVGQTSQDFDAAGISAGWVDFDNNGLLDLFVGQQNSGNLFFSQQSINTFTQITSEELVTYSGTTSGHSWADYNNDGHMDVFVLDNATSTSPNRLYRNNGDGTFTRVTGLVFDTDLEFEGFGTSWADYDNDGDLDLFMGVQSENGPTSGGDVIYRNTGEVGGYTFDRIALSPVTDTKLYQTFGSAWGDIDNDGDLDLLTGSTDFESGSPGPNGLFINNGSGAFSKISNEKFNDTSFSTFGVSLVDYDKDGFLDVGTAKIDPFSLQLGGPGTNSLLFRNNQTPGSSKNWIQIKLVGTASNRSAIGTRITLTAGGKTQIREVITTTGFASGGSLVVHFGLGTATTITSMDVKWPSGIIQNFTGLAVNEIMTVTEDGTGPALASLNPVHNDTNVATNTTLSVTLDELSSPVAGKLMLFYLNGDFVTPVLGIDVADAAQSGNIYTFTLPEKLLTSSSYNISIDAGAFLDSFGNPSPEFPSGEWFFTTSPAPAVVGLSPANSSSGVFANTTLSIEFDQPVNAAGGLIEVHKSTDLGAPVITLDAGDGVISNNSVTFTLPSKLERLITYHVSITAGAFVSAAGSNDFAGLLTDDWIFTTDGGPTATFSPASGAINVAADEALVMTFDRNVFAVAGKKIIVMDGTTTVIDLDVSTDGTIDGNTYTILAPAEGWPSLKTLNVTVDPGAFVDANQNDFAGITNGNWNFTTAAPIDTEAPSIATVSLPSAQKGFNTNDFSINATDNVAVTSVVFKIRKISGEATIDLPATESAANTWTVTMDEAAHFDAIGTEFYIEAKDGADNLARSPATGTYKIYINYTGAQHAIPGNFIGAGGTKASWKIFAIPFVLNSPNNAVTVIFDEFAGKENKVDYRLITYSAGDWTEYSDHFTTLSRGTGYFINFKTDPGVINLPELQAPANDRSNLFAITLQPGWNLIGNPYLVQIDWADVTAYNSLTGDASSVLKYNGTGYAATTQTLQAYEGAFVNNPTTTAVPVTIPFDGQTSPGGRKGFGDFGSDINLEEWGLSLILTQDEMRYEMGAIGMSPEANALLDEYDRVTPPRFFDYLEINFDHPEHFQKRFTRDIVPTQSTHTWDFTVDSNLEGQAEISWDNSAFAFGAKNLFLLDISRQKLVNMAQTGSYSFNPKESANFKVYFGDNLRIAPDKVHLGKAYPNPTSGITVMTFSLPESGGIDQLVTLDVIDAMGRTMGTISQGRFNPGYHEVSWNAKELNNGFYTYRLTVQSKQGRAIQVNKLVIK